MTSPIDPAEGREPMSRYAELIDELSGAQKARVGPPYTVFVNRWLGRRVAAVGVLVGLRPNQITAISAASTFAGIGVLAVGGPSIAVAIGVAALLLAGFALDSADGQVARLSGGGSADGEWLDHMVDAVKIAALHGAVLVHLYRAGDLGDRWLLVPLAYLCVNVGSFAAMIISDLLLRSERAGRRPATTDPTPRPSVLHSALLLPADYGLLCLTFVLIARPAAFLVTYGALCAYAIVHFAVSSRNRFRELAAVRNPR